VNYFDFFFFSFFLMDVMGEKITMNLKETALQQKKKKHVHTRKELDAH